MSEPTPPAVPGPPPPPGPSPAPAGVPAPPVPDAGYQTTGAAVAAPGAPVLPATPAGPMPVSPTTAPPGPPPVGAPAPASPSRGGRATWLVPVVAAGVGLVLGVGGAVGWHLVQNATMDSSLASEREDRAAAVATANEQIAAAAEAFGDGAPDVVVLDYLRGLEAGQVDTDVEAALVDKGVSTALLTTEAYSTVPGRVSGPTIQSAVVDEGKGTATVTAAYHTGPDAELVTDEFTLSADGDAWVLDDSAVVLVPITVDRSGSVTIAGVDVTADLSDDGTTMSGTVALLPGQYAAGFSEPSGFWGADGDASVVVGTEAAPAKISMTTTVAQAVRDEVQGFAQNQVTAWSDDCAASRFSGASCSPAVQADGASLAGRMVQRFYTKTAPIVSVTWNEDTNTFAYTAVGWLAVDGTAADGSGTITLDRMIGYTGTLTWNGPGAIDMPIGFP